MLLVEATLHNLCGMFAHHSSYSQYWQPCDIGEGGGGINMQSMWTMYVLVVISWEGRVTD